MPRNPHKTRCQRTFQRTLVRTFQRTLVRTFQRTPVRTFQRTPVRTFQRASRRAGTVYHVCFAQKNATEKQLPGSCPVREPAGAPARERKPVTCILHGLWYNLRELDRASQTLRQAGGLHNLQSLVSEP